MENIPSFNELIEKSIIDHWDLDSLTDYKGKTLQYHDVARKIEKLHIMFEASGVQRGDKIALCGRNSAAWAAAFLAVLTYGAVAVPILHEFTPDQIHHIVNHSGSKLLFVGDVVATQVDAAQMPELEGIIYIPDYSIVISRTDKLTYAREHLNEMFGRKYPKYFRAEHIHYYKEQSPDELALINYTSGTTGHSKGVMIPYRAIWSNTDFGKHVLGHKLKPGDNIISILPMAHMYGMAFEFLFEFISGVHVFFLTRMPSPAIISQALKDVKPSLMIAVPLVIEKIIRKRVFPKIQSHKMQFLLKLPVLSKKVKEKIREEVYNAFGGNLYQIIIGGAALSKEVEDFLHNINFPYTVGYGATECAPLTKGPNVLLGYYKNEEATAQAIDKNGWFHTGDLGTMDADGNVFIRGRSKNMLLGSNGQNIYPEEIEDALNSLNLVAECLVVQRDEKLVGLVYPDYEEAKTLGLNEEDINKLMEENRTQLNTIMPTYCKVAELEVRKEEFQKTPKKSIKRYLYK